MKGHTLPGINQRIEGENLPDGRAKSSAFQAKKTVDVSTKSQKKITYARKKAIEDYKLNLGDIELIPLMGYKDFVKFQQECKFIISDSGTAQEEPALLHIPVIVPRDVTERPESVENNCSFMLFLQAQNYLTASFKWLASKKPNSIEWLGDGTTSNRVLILLRTFLT